MYCIRIELYYHSRGHRLHIRHLHVHCCYHLRRRHPHTTSMYRKYQMLDRDRHHYQVNYQFHLRLRYLHHRRQHQTMLYHLVHLHYRSP